VTGVTGFNTTGKVLAVDSSANTYGYFSERLTIDYDSRALTAANASFTDAKARKTLVVAARTDSGSGKLYAQQVQISGAG